MWPWEHAAVGYLLYSLLLRVLGRNPPTGPVVAVLLLATVLPDLIDKPLSWGLGWFPTGYAVGHSVFFAIPAGILAVLLAGPGRYRRWANAAVFGYWTHLVADVVNPLRYGNGVVLARVLWPLSEQVPYDTDYGLARGLVYLEAFVDDLSTMDPASVIVLYLLVPLATVALWLLDGAPGVAGTWRTITGLRDRVR